MESDRRSLNIAFVGSRGLPAAYSGVEVAIQEIGTRLVARGHSVTAFCIGAPGQKNNSDSFRGISVRYLPSIRRQGIEMLTNAFLASLIATAGRFDIVHYQALGPASFSWLPRLLGKKTVVTVHGLDWKRAKWGRIGRLYLKLGEIASARCPNATITVSKSLQRHYMERFGHNPHFIPNSLPEDRVQALAEVAPPARSERRYVTFIGRLVPEKGIHDLIKAFSMIEADVDLFIVGGGQNKYESELREAAKNDPRIKFTGPQYGTNLVQHLRGAELFVLPSSVEGLPIGLIEAMALGVPVAVSNIPENLEVLEHGGRLAGYSFKVNSPDSLAECIRFALSNPQVTVALATLGKAAVAEKYDWDAITSQVEKVYYQVLQLPHSNIPVSADKRVTDVKVSV